MEIPDRSNEKLSDRPHGGAEIKGARLERFENRSPARDYLVEFACPEFTCICPKSGFPDFATLHIRYSPGQWCVELKSLKLYLNQYRDKGVFHEDVVNVILDDLVELLQPKEMEVVGDFNVRGNIRTLVKARHFLSGDAKGALLLQWPSDFSPRPHLG